MKSLLHLNKYLWKYKTKLFGGVFFIVLTNLFAVYSPRVVRWAFDMVKETTQNFTNGVYQKPTLLLQFEDFTGIKTEAWLTFTSEQSAYESVLKLGVWLAVLYMLIFIIKGIFLFFTRQTIIIMSRNIEFDLKNEIFAQYQRLSAAFYRKNNTGDLMNRISEDVNHVRMYLGPGIMYTINLVILFILTITFMLNVNVPLTLYVLAPLPIMSVLIYYVSAIINKKSSAVQRQQSQLSTLAQEAFSGIRVLKAYHKEAMFADYFTEECNHYKDKSLQLVKVNALFFPIILLLIGLSTTIAIYVGGLKAINGEVSLGNIAEFVIYVNMLTWPFAAVGWVTSLVQRAAASMERINEFLHEEPQIVDAENAVEKKMNGEIAFNNVSFTYPESGIKALNNVSFQLKEGETLAIVGRTGSGKSTIANLICRLFDPTEGEVTIDGTSLKDIDISTARSSIGYVPQDVFLFSDSIQGNIRFGMKEEIGMTEIEQAAKDAEIHENILTFKNGYDTIVGERGITLSGGQKQRISIARAIIKKPELLIFDDALSAVDTETEDNILQHLKTIMKNRSTILISHRISTVKNADQIMVMDEGRIVEKGNHESLLEHGGVYAELHEKQLLDDVEERV